MRIGKRIIDLDGLTEEDLTEVIKEAKRMRSRLCEARHIDETFVTLLQTAKDSDFAICSKYTGEVLNAEDWVIYDNDLQCTHDGTWATC